MQRIAVMPNLVEPNPYQPATRLTFTPEQLADLASIADIGFIHTPVARPYPTEPGHFQIAVGWRRRCAWALFRPGQEMPLDVDDGLDDAAMFRHMVLENGDRLNISGVEKGYLIDQYIAFGHTQAEAGQLFHLTQSGVSNLLRIIHHLPEPVVALVQQGALPERHARQLIGLARIKPAKAVKIAQQVATSTDPDTTLNDMLSDYLEKTGGDLHEESSFPVGWAPGMSADIEGQTEALPACTVCPNYLAHEYNRFCARPVCMKAKQQIWLRAELARLSDKLGIPAAGPDEKVEPLKLDWQTADAVRAMLKRPAKPACLRLVINSGRVEGNHYHRQAIGSDDVLLASTDPNVLKAELEAKKKKGAPADSAASSKAAAAPAVLKETEAQKAKRLEREEHEAEERREARSALHRARHDLVWLVLHTAEMLAMDMKIEGGILTWCADLTQRYTDNPQTEWPEYDTSTAEMFKKFTRLRLALMSEPLELDEFEVRRYILVRMFASRISGFKTEEQFNWARGCERVHDVAETLNLALPPAWDQPPVHKTNFNCHVCGTFMPGPAITNVDKSHGWLLVNGVVTCSTKCRAQLAEQPVAAKPVAKPSAETSARLRRAQSNRSAEPLRPKRKPQAAKRS